MNDVAIIQSANDKYRFLVLYSIHLEA